MDKDTMIGIIVSIIGIVVAAITFSSYNDREAVPETASPTTQQVDAK